LSKRVIQLEEWWETAMAEIDHSFKIAAHNSGRDMSRLGRLHCDEWEPIGDTLQTTERLADRAFRAQRSGAVFVVYFEAYTTWRDDARWDILAKSGLLSARERLPTRTLVFILTPERYREQQGTYRLEVEGEPTQQIWFHEICLWREQPQSWWETVPGLMALYPLCDHQHSAEDAIKFATQAIAGQCKDTLVCADLLTALGVFGKMAAPDLDVRHLIGVERMRESKFFQEIEDEVRKETGLKYTRAHVQDVLDARFGPEAAVEFTEALNDIQDVDKLSVLHRLAITSRGLAAFRRALARQL
jgi:predicted transposase YdaD